MKANTAEPRRLKQDVTIRRQRRRRGASALPVLPAPLQLPLPWCARMPAATACLLQVLASPDPGGAPYPCLSELVRCPEAWTAERERFCLTALGRLTAGAESPGALGRGGRSEGATLPRDDAHPS